MNLYFYRSKDNKRGYVGRDSSSNPYTRLFDHIDKAYGTTRGKNVGKNFIANKAQEKSAQIFLDYGVCGIKFDYFSGPNYGLKDELYTNLFKKWTPVNENGKPWPLDNAEVRLFIAEMYYIAYYSINSPNYISENTSQGGEVAGSAADGKRKEIYFVLNNTIQSQLEKIRVALKVPKRESNNKLKSQFDFYRGGMKSNQILKLVMPEVKLISEWLQDYINIYVMKDNAFWCSVIVEMALLTAKSPDSQKIHSILNKKLCEEWNQAVKILNDKNLLKPLGLSVTDLKINQAGNHKELEALSAGVSKHIYHIIRDNIEAWRKGALAPDQFYSMIYPGNAANWQFAIRNKTNYKKLEEEFGLTSGKYLTEPTFANSEIQDTIKAYVLRKWYKMLRNIGNKAKLTVKNKNNKTVDRKEIKRYSKDKIKISDYYNQITLMERFLTTISNAELKGFKGQQKPFYRKLASWTFGKGLVYDIAENRFYAAIDKKKQLPFHFKEETKGQILAMRDLKAPQKNSIPSNIMKIFTVY